MEHAKKYFWLFKINLFISAFTFGGGYVVIPMLRKYFVEKEHLLTEEELLNMAAVAQSTPGAIAINLSVLAGYRIGRLPGSMISCIAAVLPPLMILSVISLGYATFRDNHMIAAVLKGMQAGVAALIVDLIIDMCKNILTEKSLLLTLLVPASFFASFFLNINVALILLLCSFICLFRIWLQHRRRGNHTQC